MADETKNTSGNTSNSEGKPEGKPKHSKNNKDSIKDRLTKWFNAKKSEYWSEFKRIVWPTREVLIKQTIVVIVISLMFGLYITLLDGAFGFLFSQFARYTATLYS